MRQGDRESGDSVMVFYWSTCGHTRVGFRKFSSDVNLPPKSAASDPLGATRQGWICAAAWLRGRVGHGPRRHIAAYLVGLSLITTLASCKSSEPDQLPTPTKSTTAAPTTTKASWESKYTAQELKVYREAVQRVDAFEAESQPIWAEGKATSAAKELFQDNLLSWQSAWAQLKTYESKQIQIARGPVVLSSAADLIKILKGGAAEVTLSRCTDQTDLGGTMKGEPVQEAYDKPVIQKVDVYRYSDGRWRIGVFKTTDKTCVA